MTNIVKLDPEVDNLNELVNILGVNDKFIKLLGKLFKVNVFSNNTEILIDSEDEEKILKIKSIIHIMLV
ncbi:MAG: hypothetical protein WC154_06455 [Candidatus Izemoplasmatales bacterium]